MVHFDFLLTFPDHQQMKDWDYILITSIFAKYINVTIKRNVMVILECIHIDKTIVNVDPTLKKRKKICKQNKIYLLLKSLVTTNI